MKQSNIDDPSDGRVILNTIFLKRLRQKRGLSQDALAQLCRERHLCLSVASIKRAEAGKSVSYRTARHLARIYQTELDLLMAAKASGNASMYAPPAVDRHENAHRVRAQILDRRRILPAQGVIFFVLKCDAFDVAAQKCILESGAHMIANPSGMELAVIFGAPAHRSSDALAALRCAIKLNSLVATRAFLVLRRRAAGDVFTDAASVDPNVITDTPDNSIYLESDLATQLSTLAQFDACDLRVPGCKRFLSLNMLAKTAANLIECNPV